MGPEAVPVAGGRPVIVVGIVDDEHPDIEARFAYWQPPEGPLVPFGISVLPHDLDTSRSPALTVSHLRSLPLARWQRAARAKATEELRGTAGPLAEHAREMEGVLSGQRQSRDMRAIRAAAHLIEVAGEYRDNLKAGLPDPVAEIARQHGVNPSTARAWVFRARKAGILGPASGPTAGETVENEPENVPPSVAELGQAVAEAVNTQTGPKSHTHLKSSVRRKG
jgi:transposase-like protein